MWQCYGRVLCGVQDCCLNVVRFRISFVLEVSMRGIFFRDRRVFIATFCHVCLLEHPVCLLSPAPHVAEIA